MTKQQLIDAIAAQTDKPKADVEGVVETLTGKIAAALVSGEKVELRGFGTFSIREKKARTGRNPRTGETIQIAAKREAVFKAGKELNDRVDQPQETAVGVAASE
jgi:integration host factor beta subunit